MDTLDSQVKPVENDMGENCIDSRINLYNEAKSELYELLDIWKILKQDQPDITQHLDNK
ncbi:MAG: hypothetical protein HRT90_10585 [Candidatus Margulisbacteria bacterium]|nr:hypothetical protein [Candidatus Margulisiibacteriota bacterium]